MTPEPGDLAHLSDQVADCLRSLKAIDFELAYLAMLTREGVKPLSRWEKQPTGRERELLAGMGLIVSEVPRTVRTGRQVVETLFALSPGPIQAYERQFAGRPIDKSAETVRWEGFLFGYPPCCIERYVDQPYAPNDQPRSLGETLFHWPCKDCRITPLLLPAYQAILATVERIR